MKLDLLSNDSELSIAFNNYDAILLHQSQLNRTVKVINTIILYHSLYRRSKTIHINYYYLDSAGIVEYDIDMCLADSMRNLPSIMTAIDNVKARIEILLSGRYLNSSDMIYLNDLYSNDLYVNYNNRYKISQGK